RSSDLTSWLGYRQLYTCELITANCKPTEQNFIVSNFNKIKSSWFNNKNQSEYFEVSEELDLGEYVKPAPEDGRVLLEGYDLELIPVSRSEERRVGKECGLRWTT